MALRQLADRYAAQLRQANGRIIEFELQLATAVSERSQQTPPNPAALSQLQEYKGSSTSTTAEKEKKALEDQIQNLAQRLSRVIFENRRRKVELGKRIDEAYAALDSEKRIRESVERELLRYREQFEPTTTPRSARAEARQTLRGGDEFEMLKSSDGTLLNNDSGKENKRKRAMLTKDDGDESNEEEEKDQEIIRLKGCLERESKKKREAEALLAPGGKLLCKKCNPVVVDLED